MENFKKQLKKRQLLLAAGILLACGAVLLTRGGNPGESENLLEFIDGFQVGLLSALVTVMILFLIRNMMAMKNEERLKKLQVEETDERMVLIQQRAGSVGFSFALYGLVLGTVVAGNFNMTVFFTLLGACIFVALVGISLKVLYHFKY